MLFSHGHCYDFDLHWERIEKVANRFHHGVILFDKIELNEEILTLLSDLKYHDYRVRLKYQVTNLGLQKIGLNITKYTNDIHSKIEEGIKLVSFPTRKISTNAYANFKTENDMLYKDSLIYSASYQSEQALILNERDEIVESSICNIYFSMNNEIYTPPLESGCVEGVVRKKLLNASKVFEKVIKYTELRQYDEVYLSNAIRGIIPVKSIDDHEFSIPSPQKLEILSKRQYS